MQIDVFIVSYNRPHYLTLVLDSLANQNCNRYEISQVHLIQDGPNQKRLQSDREKIAQCIEMFQRTFPAGRIHDTKKKSGYRWQLSAYRQGNDEYKR